MSNRLLILEIRFEDTVAGPELMNIKTYVDPANASPQGVLEVYARGKYQPGDENFQRMWDSLENRPWYEKEHLFLTMAVGHFLEHWKYPLTPIGMIPSFGVHGFHYYHYHFCYETKPRTE